MCENHEKDLTNAAKRRRRDILKCSPISELYTDDLGTFSENPGRTHLYVPDHCSVLHAGNRFYDIAIQRDFLDKRSRVCPFGNLLYNAFCHMAIVVRCISATSFRCTDFLEAVQMFEAAGFYKCSLLPYSKAWADGIGEFYDKERLERFNLTMHTHDESTLKDGYWNKQTAELLPNFQLILTLIVKFNESNRYSERTYYRAFSMAQRNETFRNRMRALTPGLNDFYPTHISDQLYSIVLEASRGNWSKSQPLLQYLQLDIELLRFLVSTYSGYYSKTEGSFVIGDVGVQGNSLIITPVRETIINDTDDRALLGRARTACVVMKTAALEENAKYVRAFPIVRIVAPQNLIYSDDPVRKHSGWYYSEYPVTTCEFVLDSYLSFMRVSKRL